MSFETPNSTPYKYVHISRRWKINFIQFWWQIWFIFWWKFHVIIHNWLFFNSNSVNERMSSKEMNILLYLNRQITKKMSFTQQSTIIFNRVYVSETIPSKGMDSVLKFEERINIILYIIRINIQGTGYGAQSTEEVEFPSKTVWYLFMIAFAFHSYTMYNV